MDEPAITLSYSALESLGAGLTALDGLRPKPGEFEPFLFNPDTTWAIADNLTVVNEKLKPYTAAKKALAAQHKVTDGMAINAENSAGVAAFMAALDLWLEKTVDVKGLTKISREKLNVGHDSKKQQNKIPQTVLSKLSPILEA